MRPAQIRVFDGLRISTDHMNHLQGAFASGFEDFREILGLGKPQTGLDVTVQDDGSATIQPGVAFDYQKNRVACDDPLNLKLNFQPHDRAKFICLKYEQVEDGPVEGHPTMIWDNCSALVRDAAPDPRENLVTVAKVEKDPEGKFHVHPCVARPQACAVIPPVEPVAVPATVPAEAPPTPAPAAPAPETASAPSPAAAPSSSVQFQVRQGVVQLVSDAAASSFLRSVAAPALRKKMGPDSIDLAFTLAQAALTPDISVAGFTTHSILTGELVFPAVAGAAAPHYRFECVAHGEATPGAAALPQFAACVTQMNTVPPAQSLWSGSEFTGRGLAQFAWSHWSEAPDTAKPPLPADVLAGLQLLVQLAPDGQGFQMSLKLLWSGTIAEQSLQALETQEIGLTWQIFFGWKAVGF